MPLPQEQYEGNADEARRPVCCAASPCPHEHERMTAAQRQINLIWETTQMRVALSVIWASLVVSGSLSVFGQWLGTPDMQLAAVVFLFGVANLVTGFYFGRTNHTRTGGVGAKQGDTR